MVWAAALGHCGWAAAAELELAGEMLQRCARLQAAAGEMLQCCAKMDHVDAPHAHSATASVATAATPSIAVAAIGTIASIAIPLGQKPISKGTTGVIGIRLILVCLIQKLSRLTASHMAA